MPNKFVKTLGATWLNLALATTSLSALGGAGGSYYRTRRGGYSSQNQYLVDTGLNPVSSINFLEVSQTTGAVGGMDEEVDLDFHFEKGQKIKELLIVDGAVQNKSVFLSKDRPGVDIIEIESGKSGIVQLLATLTKYRNLEAVHVISHAKSGKLQLGDDILDAKTFEENVSALAALNGAIKPGGDLLFYGCELAKGVEGKRFLEVVKGDYDFDIAASNDLTGNDAEKANWDLEIQTGDIEATPLPESIALKDFTGTLQFTGTIDFSQWADEGDFGTTPSIPNNSNVGKVYTSASMEAILQIQGELHGTGRYMTQEHLYSSNGEDGLTLSFTLGQTFTANSIDIRGYTGYTPRTLDIYSNLGTIRTGLTLSTTLTTINLSSYPNYAGVTYIKIKETGVLGFYMVIDNFNVSNVSGGGDTTPPEVTSIVRQSPTDATTNATSATFRVTFDEDVTNVSTDGSDFTISGAGAGGTATITGASAVTGSTVFDVTVGSINTDGLLDLGFAGGQDIQDAATNAFALTITSEETYTIDQTGASTTTPDLDTFSDSGSETFTSGASTDNRTSDLTPTFTGATEIGASVIVTSSVAGSLGSAVVDGSGNWSLTPGSDLATGVHTITAQATDALGNTGAVSGGLAIIIDNTGPTVMISSTSTDPSNDNPIPVTITFSEEVEDFNENEIVVTGTANATTGDFASADSTTFTVNLTPGNDGTILVDVNAGAAPDLALNNNTAATQFSTNYDGTAPSISSSSPADNATGVAVADDITITFNEDIQFGTGFFQIKQSSDDAAIFSINAATPTATTNQASISGATLTINPAASLAAGTGYYVFILSGTPILDLAGNPFSGLNNSTDLNFTTFAPNNEPSFSLPGSPNQTVSQNAGAETVNAFATSISDGDGDTQTLTFNVSNDNNGIFSVQPDIDETTGNLTFTPMSSTFGKATVTVSLSDDGGTADSGDDQSPDQTFDIFVTPDNIKINEVHASAGTDLEFIEVYNTDASATSLSGLVMVWFNGGDDLAYKDFDLTGSTNVNGFYLIGETNYTAVTPDQTWGADGLQNGPDAVAIYVGSSSDFTGSSAGTTDGLVDIIVYGSSDDAALRASLGNPSLDVAGDASNSISRDPDGTGAFVAQSASPGVTNDVTAPTGYSVGILQTSINSGNETSVSFAFASAEVGASYNYTLSSTGGGTNVTGSGTIATATDLISGIDVSGLGDGTITLSVTLTDAAGNTGSAATDTETKDTVAPSGYTISIDQSPINSGNEGAVSFTFAGAEIGATYSYTVTTSGGAATLTSGGTITTATDQITGVVLSGFQDGTITVSVTLEDANGNTGIAATDTETKDTVAPTVILVTSTTADGSFMAGDMIAITVTFSETVNVTGTPQITLETGAADRTVNYTSGTGSSTLTFDYTVQAGDVSADLDYVATNSLALNSGTINDGAGNAATLTLATPGAAGSLGANKDLVIDTSAPTGYSVGILQTSINSGNETSVSFAFASAEVGASYNYTLSSTGGGTNVTGSGTIATATDLISSIDVSGLGDGTITLSVTLTDAAGNTGTAATDTETKDTVAPSGYTVTIDQSPINAGNVGSGSFTFAGAEIGADYSYTVTTSGGAATLTSGGTIVTGTDQVTIPGGLSGFQDGTITVSVTLEDANGNTGIAATDTETKDVVAPTISSSSPSDDATSVARDGDITLTFNEDISLGTGNVTVVDIANTANNVVIDVTNSGGQLSVSGAILTINPTANLALDTEYAIQVDATAIMDAYANAYAGISNTTTLNFTTDNPSLAYGPSGATLSPTPSSAGSFSYFASQGGQEGLGFTLSTDGQKAYMVNSGSVDKLFEYSLSTPFDISTATATTNISIAAQNTNPQGVTMSADGSKIYMVGASKVIYQYTLNTPFDLSAGVSVTSQSFSGGGDVRDVFIGPNGQNIYTIDRDRRVAGWTLGTAYDISTLSSNGAFSVTGFGSNQTQGLAISNDGTKLFVSALGKTIREYEMSTPFSIGTASATGNTFSTSSGSSFPSAVYLTAKGDYMYVANVGFSNGTGNNVNQYSIEVAGFTEVAGNDGSVSGSIEVTVTDALFNNAGGTFTHTTDYTVTNLPAGFTPAMNVSGDGLVATLTLTGNATAHENVDDLADLSFTFQNSAFNGFDASEVANAVSANSGFGIDFDNETDPPVFSSSTPSDDATTYPTADNLTITFNEDIQFGSGNITIQDLDAPSTFVTIDVTSPGSQAAISGGVLTINPTSDLAEVTNYAIQIDNTAITDLVDNAFAGISDNTTLNFLSADETPPTITITTPIETDDQVNGAEDADVTISGTTSGAEDGQTVTVTFSDGNNPDVQVTGTVSSDAWTASDADISGLDNGNITVTADVDDQAGNSATQASETITLDNMAPTLAITTPIEGDDIANAAEDNDVTVSGTTSGAEDGQTVTVTFNDGTNPTIQVTGTVSSNAWTASDADISGLDNGNITVTADVDDAVGNSATQTSETITLDQTAPTTTSFTRKTPTTSTTNADMVTYLATFSEDVTGVDMNDFIAIGVSGTDIAVSQVTAATYDVTVSGGDMANFNGAMALNFNSPSITDLAGNALPNTEPATDEIYTLDNTAPTITISTPIEGDNIVEISESSDVEISGTTTGVEDGQTVTVAFNDGANTPVSVNATVTSNAWTIAATDVSGLNDGSITVTADVSDVAGNAATQASETITLDQAPPTLSSSSPADDATNVDIETTIAITFNENIVFGSGNIQLIDLDDNSGDITIDASSPGAAASISGAVLTIANPSGFLEESANYAVQIASTAIQDAGGNAFAGISDNTTLNFTTEAAPTISIADATVTEGNSGTVNATFTISLDKTSPKTITLDYATSDNTATTADSDYSAVSTTTLTFNPSETSHDVTVTVNGDTRDEDAETFFVDGINPTNASFADNQGSGTITDDDDPPTVAFTSTTSSGAESVSSADITVEVSTASSKTITVDYAITGTATGSGTDYTLADGTVTFAADDVSETITIASIVDDAILETNETVIVTLSSPSNATLGTNTIHTYTIDNNDNAAVTMADASVSEDGTSVTVTATLDNQVQGGFDVTVTSADGTASQTGGDYTAVSETLTFTGNSAETQTLTVAVTNDAIVEVDETITLSMGSLSTSATVDISDEATVTITNDDASTVTIADVASDENNGNITVTLTLDNEVVGGLSVDVSTTDGTATTGDSDYTALTSETVTFTGTAAETQTVTIAATGDSKVEVDETLTASMDNLSVPTVASSTITITDTGTITISNDDTAAVTIADISGNEDDGNITVTLTLDNPVDGGLSVDVSTADGTATTADSDYTAVTAQTLNFSGTAGETQTFTVSPTSDNKIEADETIAASMSNLTVSTVASSDITITDTGTITLTNDDTATVTIADVSGNEDAGAITLTATLDNPVDGGFTVDISTADGSAVSTDYTALTGETLTFSGTAGETQTFTVTPTIDEIVEGDETITVSMGNLGATSLPVTITDEATVTIANDDNAAVTIADVSGNEDDGNITVTLTLDGDVDGGLSVDVSTADGTATTADSDYTALASETVTFTGTAGETQTVTVASTEDAKVEADETLTASMSNLIVTTVAAETITISDTGTITLTNDDNAAVIIADASGNEDAGAITLTATLDNPVDGGFTIDVSTADGTATSGDYTSLAGETLTFSGTAGEAQTFTVTPTADEAVEDNETVTVSMGNLASTTLSVTISDEATVTITNDDNAPVITAGQTFPIEGILAAGDVVGTAVATDTDAGTTFSAWTIVSGNTDDAFAIAAGTGVITVNDPSVIDLIATPSYTLTLTVSDGTNTSAQETVTIEVGDGIAPTVTLSSDVGAVTNVAPITVTATFSELVLGFALEDLTLTNATAANLSANDAQTTYTFDLTPETEGNVGVNIDAGKATDAVGNLSEASNSITYFYDIMAPTATLTTTADAITSETSGRILIDFNEMVAGLEIEDIQSSSGTLSNFTGSGNAYSVDITGLSEGTATITVPVGAASDVAGNGNIEGSVSWEVDLTGPSGFTVNILNPAINDLNEDNFRFRINGAEPRSTFNYTINSIGGGTAVTGSGELNGNGQGGVLDDIDVSGLGDGVLTLSVEMIDEFGNLGAIATDEIQKNTEDESNGIAQGYSPNGDNIDDTWTIPGIEDIPNNSVTIFNRYGTKVWETTNYDNDDNAWDSQANVDNIFGSAGLPDGTYFYVIEFPGTNTDPKSGFVILKR